jgi:predicted 2-oxoglutarate/Fe(II)-dependent dioxygenase YbiX
MKEIFMNDNFLSHKECDNLIELYHNTESYDNSDGVWSGRARWPDYTEHQKNKLITERKKVCEEYFNEKFEIDNLHLMVWKVGHKMTPHSDYGSSNEFPHREFASIIYLNDNYEGGNLVIPELKLVNRPKKGQLVTFRGGKLFHGVTTITKGTRYTSICWFKVI